MFSKEYQTTGSRYERKANQCTVFPADTEQNEEATKWVFAELPFRCPCQLPVTTAVDQQPSADGFSSGCSGSRDVLLIFGLSYWGRSEGKALGTDVSPVVR